MRMTRDEFLGWPHKAVTLIGMSGAGKAALAQKVPKSTWFHYSADYRIGTKYLAEPILDNVKRQAMQVGFLRDLLRSDSIYIANNVKVHNLAPIATFLGMVGRRDLGGLPLEEFKRRQCLHRNAQLDAMRDVASFIGKAREIYGYDHILNDTSDSLCELEDESTIDLLAERTLIVYLEADEEVERRMVQQAVAHPAPIYFQEVFFDRKVGEYLNEQGLDCADDIVPNDFLRWVLPALMAHRAARYRALAEAHGYIVDSRQVDGLGSEADFVALAASVL